MLIEYRITSSSKTTAGSPGTIKRLTADTAKIKTTSVSCGPKMLPTVSRMMVHTIKGEIVSHFKKVAYKKNMKEKEG